MSERPPGNGDPFYVGYLPKAPAAIASRTRALVVFLLVLGLGIGATLIFGQSPFDDGVFEFGVDKKFQGLLVEKPYPLLLLPSPDGGEPVTHYLTAFGKFGAAELARGLDGQAVEVTGSLIYNERQRMIEAHAIDAITDGGEGIDALQARPELQLGELALQGEIVDSKCHLGVMKPGRGKPHKACAIRCISGGIPPVLRVQDRDGNYDYLMLVSRGGESVNDDVLDYVAEPIEIRGSVVRRGDVWMLYSDPDTYRLLNQ